MVSRQSTETRLVAWLVVSLFLTGACSLVYQQLWLRLLSLVFGATVYAAATAIAAFMAGLALGGYLAGKLADRTSRPLAWYGASEVAAGSMALVTAAALALTERVYVGIAGAVGEGVGVLTVVRLVLSFVVLIVPATVMGASTPLVIKAASMRSGRVGERTGLLYATNTAGALAGTLIAGFVLIGEHGIAFSFRAAAVVNIAVGVATVLASRLWFERASTAAVGASVPEPAMAAAGVHGAASTGPEVAASGRVWRPVAPATRRLVLWVFAVSGFASLGLEIVWFRVLVLYADSTVYAFTAMLTVVLVGISLGSAVATPLLRRDLDWVRVLAWLEVAAGVAALTSFWLLARGFRVERLVDDVVPIGSGSVREMFLLAGLTILPTTVLLGMAWPIGVRLWAEGDGAAPRPSAGGPGGDDPAGNDRTGDAIGRFYALNLTGAIAGSLVAGFVLLPLLGSSGTVVVLAACLLASGVALLFAAGRRAHAGAAVVVFALLVVVAVPSPWTAAVDHRFPERQLAFNEEGVQSTVWVTDDAAGGRALYLDGMPQATNDAFVISVHEQIGLLPLALHPEARSALVVGLGGGVTPGAMSRVPAVDVTVVELSHEVVDAAAYFAEWNNDVLDRPNVDVRVDDGRNYLLTTDDEYDVITADIIQPRTPGAGKLWSKEYWELARNALAPGGVMLQWVGTDRTSLEYDLIVRTFLDVFPHATLWAAGSLLVGTVEPLRIDPAAVRALLADPAAAEALARVGVTSVDSLLALYTAGPEQLAQFVGDGSLLTDDFPRIEYWRSLDLPADAPLVDWAPVSVGADPASVLGPG